MRLTQGERGIEMEKYNKRLLQLIYENFDEESFNGESALMSCGFSKVDNGGWLSFIKKYGEATVTINEQDSEFDIQVSIPGVGDLSYPRISRGHYYGGPVSEVFPKFIEEIDADLNNEDAPAMVSKCAPTLTALKADLQKVLE